MKRFDILIPGEINPDLILSGDVVPEFGQVEKLVDSAVLMAGSSSVITACGAARLGAKVAFIGVCGDDLFGHFMLSEMNQRGVDTSAVIIDPDLSTGLTVILNKGNDRAMLTHTGTMNALHASRISDELLVQCRHLHLASFFLQTALRPDLPDLFQRAHRLGLSTSLDTNWDPTGEWEDVPGLLAYTDIFLPNENEALAISRARTVGQALKRLGQQAGMVAIKRGAEGAIACHGDQTASVQALCCDKVVDTVGAGDSFNAGFLFGHLSGWGLEKSLWLAAVCGSLSTRAAGGTAAQPSLEEALKYT